MRIRGYQPGDVEAMYQLDLACFTRPYQFDREMMLEFAEAPGALVAVAEDPQGAMCGFVIAHAEPTARYAYIVTIDVSPSSQHMGIGSALIRQGETQAATAGLTFIALHVATDNTSAIAFYRRHGYQQTGIEKNFYRETGTDALIFAKKL